MLTTKTARGMGWGLLSLVVLASVLTAEDKPAILPGHSAHGEAFDEGPRQQAYLMGNTGKINFPATSRHPDVQAFINQGVGQLHGFWYFEAERSFRQAAALDPECAIAYWGMALANVNNQKRAKSFIAEAVKRKNGITPREAAYIDAVDNFHKADPKKDKERYEAYTKSLERIARDYPDDLDAKAFLGLQLWDNRGHGMPIVSHLAISALLYEVLEKEPFHPCHHYLIHLWNYENDERALLSASRCGQSAPGIAHMWHMPGHIYSQLKRYPDAVWQQEASARVDHAHMMRDRILPDQIHNFAHNNEWLIRNLSYLGRVRDLVDLAKNMTELPRHPKYNTVQRNGSSSYYGRLRLFEELNRFELWDDMITLSQTVYLEPTDVPLEQVKRLRHLGTALIRKGAQDEGLKILAQLQTRLQEEREKQRPEELKKYREAAGKRTEEYNKKLADSAAQLRPAAPEMPEEPQLKNGTIDAIDKAMAELEGHLAVAQGDFARGLQRLRDSGGVDAMYLARVQLQTGDKDGALKSAADTANGRTNQVHPLAMLADLYVQAGEEQKARETFEKLRNMSGQIDIASSPVFLRLAPLAEKMGLPVDWRMAQAASTDVGDRPELDALGPFRWSPYQAPAFNLVDVKQAPVSLQQYQSQGKPVIVVFFLGHGCLHCSQQLQAFAPRVKDFDAAGISLVGISMDGQEGLQKSHQNYGDQPFPFPLASDESLSIFKAYRAYDDFEKVPLHGLFVVDGAGRVRWQDISYEPFQDVDFVLKESQRLLSLTHTSGSPQTPAPAVSAAESK